MLAPATACTSISDIVIRSAPGFRCTQVFGFVQLPLYQYVNGVQLTSHWAALASASFRY